MFTCCTHLIRITVLVAAVPVIGQTLPCSPASQPPPTATVPGRLR